MLNRDVNELEITKDMLLNQLMSEYPPVRAHSCVVKKSF